jgi:hypothetical protein
MSVAAGAIGYTVLRPPQAATSIPYRYEIPPPAGAVYEGLFAISPDGRRLAFTAADATGRRSLWVRPLDGLTAQRIENGDGALYPFWSPDGRSLGFFADRKLKTVHLGTGTVRILSDTGEGGGGAWNTDGVIVFADESPSTARRLPIVLRRVAASGGATVSVTRFEPGGQDIQAFPHFLPDGRHYLYMHLGVGEPGVYVGRLDADDPKRILPALVTVVSPHININGPVRATYAAGHLFYLDSSHRTLMAQPFDIGQLRLTGDALRIAEDVENLAPGLSAYDVSANGLLVYRPLLQRAGHGGQVSRFALSGTRTDHLGETDPHPDPRVSSASAIVLTNWPAVAQP